METPAVHPLLDLDTPPPSPPSKKPKLEPPATPSSHNPFNQNQVAQHKEAQEPHQAMQQNNQDLPEDFLEPLDTNMNKFIFSSESSDSSSAPPLPLPPCSSDKQSGSSPPAAHAQRFSSTISIHQQSVNAMTATSSSPSASTLAIALVPPIVSLPTQVRHLRGALPPLPSSIPPSHYMINVPTSAAHLQEMSANNTLSANNHPRGCRQFWKAGDYDGDRSAAPSKCIPGGIDHVRVHPKFLHSNATSHKWALGAVAELLDNAVDEVNNGATFVNVDMERNPQDGGPMLIFEDDGGGMDPDRLRQCMSLGYSVKSKQANTIGQYGNGFKTSTMRLGSDVLVFTRRPAKSGGSPTQSIGMLSYSFLRDTYQEDIIVPMVDYEIESLGLRKLVRSTAEDWTCNLDTITKWSPYCTEADLLNQFQTMKYQGAKIIIFNLWEDDEGQMELDFEEDSHDIQVRGANRDENKIAMAEKYPNSRHYLTYRHSLRSYASILYLRLPDGFHINLRGKEVEHHPLVNDMMLTQEHTYRPHSGGNVALKETNMMAVVTIGFVKDAKEHIDVQGFNVYHKNRLIKPFWRIWNAASSQGRGIIAVLEANFVEPAHDKQGFERTVVLGRLEARLLQMQKAYWKEFSHRVGYAKKDTPRVHYPARGLIRLEAPPVSRMMTRGIASMGDSFASEWHFPEAVSMFHTTQEDCSGIEGFASDYSTNIHTKSHMEVECVGSPDSPQALPRIDENTPPPSNRNDTDAEKLKLEVKQNEHLKYKVLELQKTVVGLREAITEVTRQRDKFKLLVDDQARRQATEEQDLKAKLKAAYVRIQLLEGERSGPICSKQTTLG
ncbi:hypothetical protein GOP47_0007345 [Adiantum capillus-veneris]|uniref:Morc S5 domain-containing protein n=1 Tax=Adiantum capillus-veneris TaxID=13818 RepID=A0A9D4V0I1_ADICA|nr:hypothetical protein GOP47_0007345 [Adiantum capillus-veneris]